MAPGNKRGTHAWRMAGLALAAVLAVLAVGEAARAEYPPPLIFGRILTATPEDLPMLREASAPLFAAATAGVTRDWSNPQTGNSGTIMLRRIFALRGMPCRTFDYTTWTARHTNETRIELDWCKVPDDGWKLVDPREPVPGSPEK